MWKNMVGYAGVVLAGYEAVLLFQLLTGSSSTSRLPLCLVLKLVAFGSILSTREYLQLSFSAVEASPLCILYFLASFGVLRLIGNNTKAEVARAQQLEKLQRLNCTSLEAFCLYVELATMADRLIHSRVFKVSKGLNRLDLLCEQHRRQIGHREGLPDWERPKTPAGKSSGRHGRTPAFFAWSEDSDSVEQRPRNSWQTETPQKVARTLDLTEEDRQPAPERPPSDNGMEITPGQDEDEGMSEDVAIEVDSDTEEKESGVTGRSIAVSPIREDILDRVRPPAASSTVALRVPTPPASVDTAPSSYRAPSSPRYIHGRRLHSSDAAVPTPQVAGVTTEQADCNRMSRSSGKRIRSASKPASTYIHQSGAANTNNRSSSSFSHKRLARSAAERTFGGSSVFRTLNMDTYGWPGSQRVVTGLEAMSIANRAEREFLGRNDEETKRSEPPVQAESDVIPVEISRTEHPAGISSRKGKRVSFGGESVRPQPRTLPVLADKTTQTEELLQPVRRHTRTIPSDAPSRDPNSPARCPACDTVVDESGRPRKVPKTTANAVAEAPAQQRNFRRTSNHLTNPIMTNPRYPPEPSIFRGRTTYNTMSTMEELLGLEDPKKQQLVRIYPKYVRLRQGSEIRYRLKLTRPPTKVNRFSILPRVSTSNTRLLKGKAVTIHVRVIMNKTGISTSPSHLVITSKDWRQTREITVTSSVDSELRTFQIHHKIHETYDEVYNATALLPSLFVSVLQKEATFLFGFGCGLDGRMGTTGDSNTTTPTPFACRWLHPLLLSCGKAHSAIVDVYSNLYCFGLGANGQLGQGDDCLESSQEPIRVPHLTSTCVQLVACGANHTLCMSVDGRVYAWGDNSFGQIGMGTKTIQPVGSPFRVEKLVSIRGIACGGNQSFIMTKTNILASGSNVAGQLGMGDRIDRTSFEHIPFFRKVYVGIDPFSELNNGVCPRSLEAEDVELSCGMYHTLALSGGHVYSWGVGDDGRLGHGDHESRLIPTLITLLRGIQITTVACGGSHSGAVGTSGDVFMWGSGSLGQLGLGKTRSRSVPTRVRVLQDAGVSHLSFGEWHSLALCRDGTLYAWGFGEEGQLGLPDEDLEPTRRVALLPVVVHSLSGTGATMISCGGSHSFVVTVQENRRQQIAQMHRRASQLNILQEEQRLAAIAMLGRRQSVKMLYERRASERAIPVDESNKPQSKKSQQKPTRKCNSARRAEPSTQRVPAAIADSFSWKTRPLTSRLSLRNACRQQNREMEGWREARTPPDALPPTTRGRLEVSPRLLRLSEQVNRRRKPTESPAVTRAVADAVHTATENCLRLGSANFCMETRTTKRTPTRHDEDLEITHQVYGLRVESVSSLGDDENGETKYDSDEEISLFPANSRFQAMEADVRTR
ncbi:Ultraviolet-B receptor UVR8 [Phytophthora citrophthora]|uniref:Ultraviolet-B receptor UVR8 n=1 Tax=Phytophthora citrophthora TaxID=4793 RepID=A0AAD9LCP0_9STRA|nr:Ultraviolet-B receptor UVR8 [Phytophthora citrophthora]